MISLPYAWAYRVLAALCREEHGNVEFIVRKILEHLLPAAIMTHTTTTSSSVPLRSVTALQHNTIVFVQYDDC